MLQHKSAALKRPVARVRGNHLNAVRPIAGRVFHHAQRVYGVRGVRFGVRHEQTGLLQPITERVHLRVDEQREQMLHRDVVPFVFDAKGFREALYVRLEHTTRPWWAY